MSTEDLDSSSADVGVSGNRWEACPLDHAALATAQCEACGESLESDGSAHRRGITFRVGQHVYFLNKADVPYAGIIQSIDRDNNKFKLRYEKTWCSPKYDETHHANRIGNTEIELADAIGKRSRSRTAPFNFDEMDKNRSGLRYSTSVEEIEAKRKKTLKTNKELKRKREEKLAAKANKVTTQKVSGQKFAAASRTIEPLTLSLVHTMMAQGKPQGSSASAMSAAQRSLRKSVPFPAPALPLPDTDYEEDNVARDNRVGDDLPRRRTLDDTPIISFSHKNESTEKTKEENDGVDQESNHDKNSLGEERNGYQS